MVYTGDTSVWISQIFAQIVKTSLIVDYSKLISILYKTYFISQSMRDSHGICDAIILNGLTTTGALSLLTFWTVGFITSSNDNKCIFERKLKIVNSNRNRCINASRCMHKVTQSVVSIIPEQRCYCVRIMSAKMQISHSNQLKIKLLIFIADTSVRYIKGPVIGTHAQPIN